MSVEEVGSLYTTGEKEAVEERQKKGMEDMLAKLVEVERQRYIIPTTHQPQSQVAEEAERDEEMGRWLAPGEEQGLSKEDLLLVVKALQDEVEQLKGEDQSKEVVTLKEDIKELKKAIDLRMDSERKAVFNLVAQIEKGALNKVQEQTSKMAELFFEAQKRMREELNPLALSHARKEEEWREKEKRAI